MYGDLYRLEIHFLGTIASVTVTPDNKYIISGSYDKSIKVFDIQTKQQVHHFENVHKGAKVNVDFQFIFF